MSAPKGITIGPDGLAVPIAAEFAPEADKYNRAVMALREDLESNTATQPTPKSGAVKKFKPDNAETYPTGWAPIGLTSAETLPSFASDGGDATVLDTAEVAAVRNILGTVTNTFSFVLHSFNKKDAAAAAPAGPGRVGG